MHPRDPLDRSLRVSLTDAPSDSSADSRSKWGSEESQQDLGARSPAMLSYLPDLANIATLTGLCVAFIAVVLAVRQELASAMSLALVAILIDHADGALARRDTLRSAAERAFGAHLDCYADFVAKGIFPAMFLLVLGDFQSAYWPIALLHLVGIAVRYSYEFVPDAQSYGLSPDYSIAIFALIYLLAPILGNAYPVVLAVAMLLLVALNISSIEVPKLTGWFRGAFLGLLMTLAVLVQTLH